MLYILSLQYIFFKMLQGNLFRHYGSTIFLEQATKAQSSGIALLFL